MRKICLVAVDIRSTHNVGAFFRTCDGFSAALALVGITPRPLSDNDDRLPYVAAKANAAIEKTALGATKTVQWRYFPNWNEAINTLRAEGYAIAAIEQSENSRPLSSLSKSDDIALLVGPEVTGLESEVLESCDYIYEIPMSGKKESFNVSVAAGIALYETRR